MFHPGHSTPRLVTPSASREQLPTVQRWFAELIRLPRFAHHPACRHWSNHLIRFRNEPLCLGCTCMSLGMLTGALLLYPILAQVVAPFQIFAIGLFCYAPTMIQIYYQRYLFKIVSRFALGNGVALALGAAFAGHAWIWPDALWSLGFLASFIAILIVTLRWRARHIDVPCQRCPEGQYPFCSWRLAQLEATVARQATEPDFLPNDLAAFVSAVTTQLGRGEQDGPNRVQFVTLTGHDGEPICPSQG